MTQATVTTRAPLSTVTAVDTAIDTVSGISWAAVFAGAFVAAAFSLALVALGAGIGLVSVSPWSSSNPSVTTFTVLAAAWFIAVQLFASGLYTPLQMLVAASVGQVDCLVAQTSTI